MPKLLVNDKFKIDGLNIRYKVSGPAPATNNPVFVLILRSLNYSSKLPQTLADEYEKIRSQNNLPKANYIFVDFPGNGDSDKSTKPDLHYTIPFFTQVTAQAVEEVQRKLNINKMQLFVVAAGDGGLIAMDLLRARSEWVKDSSPIQVRYIMNCLGTINFEGTTSKVLVQEKYKNVPDLAKYVKAIDKVAKGDIKNRNEMIKLQAKVAPMLIDEGKNHNLRNKLVGSFPRTAMMYLRFMHTFAPSKKTRDQYGYYLEALTGCSIDVWNHFSSKRFDGFSLEKTIPENLDVYNKVPIVYVNAADDVFAAPAQLNAQRIQAFLPDNMAQITLKGYAEKIKDQYALLMKELFAGALNEAFVKKSGDEVVSSSFPCEYTRQYNQIKQELLQPMSTTAISLGAMGGNYKGKTKQPLPVNVASVVKDKSAKKREDHNWIEEFEADKRPVHHSYEKLYSETLKGVQI